MTVLDTVDSTNAECLRAPRPWRVVAADEQTAGRGRLSRSWDTPSGMAVALSAVLPMPAARGADWGWLPLLTGVAVREAIEPTGIQVGLKWPNDVLAAPTVTTELAPSSAAEGVAPTAVDRAGWLKLCGILCQAVPGQELVVVGLGINIAQGVADLLPTATSIAAAGGRVPDREDLVCAVLDALASRYAQWVAGGAAFAALRERYRASCLTIGSAVRIHEPDGESYTGQAVDVDDGGSLVVTLPDGGQRTHAAGDVEHVRPA